MKHSFGSDNHSGVAQEIMAAIVDANSGFSISYGADPLTKRAKELIREQFGASTHPFFMFNGTAANVLALRAATNSYNSILCSDCAHIFVDECGAPERATLCKLIPIKSRDGKIDRSSVERELVGFGDQHRAQPKLLSISQPTELGTLYTIEEIEELASLIHSYNGYLHMDGARLSNAAVSLKRAMREFTVDAGVDLLSFGGTKNGMLMGEAILFFRSELAENFKYIRKESGQLFSKSRFIAAQFIAFLTDDLYLKLARNANEMANYLASSIEGIEGVKISRPVETNAVFALMESGMRDQLQRLHYFYTWNEESGEVRWVCSFNTQKRDIDNFIADLKRIANPEQ